MESTSHGNGNNDMYLFQYLVVMFQNLAMQQLGKLINPMTGKLERDLQQARITIDMIQMVKEKTAGNLNEEEQRLIDQILLDLQMNYVDEVKRSEEEPEEEPEDKEVEGEEDEGAQAVSDDAAEETPSADASAANPKDVKKASRSKKAEGKKKNG